MRNQLGPGVIGAAGLGAGLMFFLDPDMGNRRRAILGDKLVSLGHLAGWAADKTARDVRNRLNGAVQSIRSRFRDTPAIDVVLMERVRSKMGRAVSHPHAIHVTVQNGRVRLTGEILSEELDDLIRSVSAVNGIKEIDNHLTTYAEPNDTFGLQGGHTRRGSRFALLQSNWPPAVRLMVGTAGIVATATGIRQRGVLGLFLGGIGTGMVILAITNQSVRQMIERASEIAEKPRTIPFPERRQRAG